MARNSSDLKPGVKKKKAYRCIMMLLSEANSRSKDHIYKVEFFSSS